MEVHLLSKDFMPLLDKFRGKSQIEEQLLSLNYLERLDADAIFDNFQGFWEQDMLLPVRDLSPEDNMVLFSFKLKAL